MLLYYTLQGVMLSSRDKLIIKTLCGAFYENERMRTLIRKQNKAFKLGLHVVITYCYFMVKKLRGVFLSSNQATVLLYYQKSQHYHTIRNCWHYLHIAFLAIGICRIGFALKREAIVKATRQAQLRLLGERDYLYIWFLAQKEARKDIKGLIEAKNQMLLEAEARQLPIYIETTEERLLPIYERIGFVFYDFKEDASIGLRVWFGRMGARLE